MARQIQTPDTLVSGGKIVFGTALHRLQEVADDNPQDQEFATFYAGDIRDVCAACDSKDEVVGKLAEKVRGSVPGAEFSLPIADVRKLIAVVQKPKTPAK